MPIDKWKECPYCGILTDSSNGFFCTPEERAEYEKTGPGWQWKTIEMEPAIRIRDPWVTIEPEMSRTELLRAADGSLEAVNTNRHYWRHKGRIQEPLCEPKDPADDDLHLHLDHLVTEATVREDGPYNVVLTVHNPKGTLSWSHPPIQAAPEPPSRHARLRRQLIQLWAWFIEPIEVLCRRWL